MESELLILLSSYPLSEYSALARYIEPHLPLIKSRTLGAFYYDLRYQKMSCIDHISILEQDAIKDYRLRSVLERIVCFIKTSQRI